MILGRETGEIVRELRRVSGLSQQGLAERAGTAQGTVAGIESGQRGTSLTTLVRLAEAAHRQLRVEIEPLDADILNGLEDDEAVTRARSGVGSRLRRVLGLDFGLEPPAYRVEGLAAVAILGAPVKVPGLDLALADTPQSLEWLTQRRNALAIMRIYRSDPAIDPWQFEMNAPAYDRSMIAESDFDPYAYSRDWLLESTAGKPFWVQSATGQARVRLADPEVVARCVSVETESGTFAVEPLESLITDPALARYVTVMRQHVAG